MITHSSENVKQKRRVIAFASSGDVTVARIRLLHAHDLSPRTAKAKRRTRMDAAFSGVLSEEDNQV